MSKRVNNKRGKHGNARHPTRSRVTPDGYNVLKAREESKLRYLLAQKGGRY